MRHYIWVMLMVGFLKHVVEAYPDPTTTGFAWYWSAGLFIGVVINVFLLVGGVVFIGWYFWGKE